MSTTVIPIKDTRSLVKNVLEVLKYQSSSGLRKFHASGIQLWNFLANAMLDNMSKIDHFIFKELEFFNIFEFCI